MLVLLAKNNLRPLETPENEHEVSRDDPPPPRKVPPRENGIAKIGIKQPKTREEEAVASHRSKRSLIFG